MRFLKGLSPTLVGRAAAVITVIIWTSFIVIARASADPARGATLTPFDIALARILGASAVLLPWGWWLVQRDRSRATESPAGQTGLAPTSSFFGLSPLSLRVTATAGVFGGLLYAMLAYSGFVYAPAAHASVLMPGSLPLWTALLAVWVLGDRITSARAMGLGFIVAGDLMVGGASLLHAFDGGNVWKGDILFMVAAFCWSVYSVLARRHKLDAVRATIAITAFAFFTYVPVYGLLLALHAVPSHFLTAPVGDVLFQMFFQGCGSVVISGITFTKMIQHFGPVRSTMITALVPGLSALAAVVFLGEPLHWNLLAGLVLVTVGILFGVRAVTPVAIKKEAVQAYSTGAKG
ncbi:MAG: DMT family transporter [Rhodoferax sp.]|nr:DMT family transporter [Rhodoferax sp.]